jgi:hypothetical protein
MDKTTARALRGLFVALNYSMSREAAELMQDILLEIADQTPDSEICDLYRSMVGAVIKNEERDPLPKRSVLRLVK